MTHFWRSRMALNSWALAKVTKAWKGRSDGDGSVFGGGKGQLWSKMMEQRAHCNTTPVSPFTMYPQMPPLYQNVPTNTTSISQSSYKYHPCITVHHVPTNTTCVSESTQKYHLYVSSYKQGTFNCAILESEIGGSGDPRWNWESERGRKVLLLFAKWSKRTIEMQEVYILPLKKPGLWHLSRLSKKSNISFNKRK